MLSVRVSSRYAAHLSFKDARHVINSLGSARIQNDQKKLELNTADGRVYVVTLFTQTGKLSVDYQQDKSKQYVDKLTECKNFETAQPEIIKLLQTARSMLTNSPMASSSSSSTESDYAFPCSISPPQQWKRKVKPVHSAPPKCPVQPIPPFSGRTSRTSSQPTSLAPSSRVTTSSYVRPANLTTLSLASSSQATVPLNPLQPPIEPLESRPNPGTTTSAAPKPSSFVLNPTAPQSVTSAYAPSSQTITPARQTSTGTSTEKSKDKNDAGEKSLRVQTMLSQVKNWFITEKPKGASSTVGSTSQADQNSNPLTPSSNGSDASAQTPAKDELKQDAWQNPIDTPSMRRFNNINEGSPYY